MGPSLAFWILFAALILVLGIVIGVVLAWCWRRFHRPPGLPIPPTCPPDPPPCPAPIYKVPDDLAEGDLSAALSVRLSGTPANGVPQPAASASATPLSKVVWVDHGNEVLVHLDSTSVRILDRMVLVSVDMETDQTGRTPLVCSFAVSGAGELGGLIAVTDNLPQGSGVLASTWGKQLQTAVWSSLIGLSNDHAGERSLTPRAISAAAGKLSLQAGEALVATATGGTK